MAEETDDALLHEIVVKRLVPGWYPKYARPARRVLAEQRLILDNFIEDIGIRGFHHVSDRVKSEESVTKALIKRRYEGLYDFPDMAGLRIVVFSLQDVQIVAECFLRQVHIGKVVKLLRDEAKDKDGYQARHLDLEVQGSYVRSGMPVRMEVQIRTLGQHMFDTLSRAYLYKSEAAIPKDHRDALDAQLRPAESLVSRLQVAADEIHAADSSGAMCPDSFIRIVRELLQEEVTISEAVDTVLFERDRGTHTNGELRKIFADPNMQGKVEDLLRLEAPLAEDKQLFGPKRRTYRLYLMVARDGFDLIKRYFESAAGDPGASS